MPLEHLSKTIIPEDVHHEEDHTLCAGRGSRHAYACCLQYAAADPGAAACRGSCNAGTSAGRRTASTRRASGKGRPARLVKPAPVLAYSPGLPAPMPHIAPVPQSADKFPDKDGNKSVLVSDQPVSTFSVDVDTASYAFVRRMLSDGRMPPQQAVRVE